MLQGLNQGSTENVDQEEWKKKSDELSDDELAALLIKKYPNIYAENQQYHEKKALLKDSKEAAVTSQSADSLSELYTQGSTDHHEVITKSFEWGVLPPLEEDADEINQRLDEEELARIDETEEEQARMNQEKKEGNPSAEEVLEQEAQEKFLSRLLIQDSKEVLSFTSRSNESLSKSSGSSVPAESKDTRFRLLTTEKTAQIPSLCFWVDNNEKALGVGSFGVVINAYNLKPDVSHHVSMTPHYVVKIFKQAHKSWAGLSSYDNEVRITQECMPHVYKTMYKSYFAMIMPKLPGDELAAWHNRLKKNHKNQYSLVVRLKMIAMLGEQLCDMHSKGIVHGDIKLTNIIAFLSIAGMPQISLIDFGLSHRIFDEKEDVDPWGFSEDSYHAGTPDYVAPEVDFDRRVALNSDIFSLAGIVAELLGATRILNRLIGPVLEPRKKFNLDGVLTGYELNGCSLADQAMLMALMNAMQERDIMKRPSAGQCCLLINGLLDRLKTQDVAPVRVVESKPVCASSMIRSILGMTMSGILPGFLGGGLEWKPSRQIVHLELNPQILSEDESTLTRALTTGSSLREESFDESGRMRNYVR